MFWLLAFRPNVAGHRPISSRPSPSRLSARIGFLGFVSSYSSATASEFHGIPFIHLLSVSLQRTAARVAERAADGKELFAPGRLAYSLPGLPGLSGRSGRGGPSGRSGGFREHLYRVHHVHHVHHVHFERLASAGRLLPFKGSPIFQQVSRLGRQNHSLLWYQNSRYHNISSLHSHVENGISRSDLSP